MYKYLKKLVEEAPEDMTGVTKTPAGNHLFTTNLDCDKLPEKTVQVFHHIVAKLLYGRSSSSKRTRHLNFRYYFIMDQVKKATSR